VACHQKGAQAQQQTILFIDESGVYPLPSVVRTYAPVGHTPILNDWLVAAYEQVYAAERPWRAPDVLPGISTTPPVSYPLPLHESTLNALHREAIRLGTLPFEGAT
jgi:hypothetical protein